MDARASGAPAEATNRGVIVVLFPSFWKSEVALSRPRFKCGTWRTKLRVLTAAAPRPSSHVLSERAAPGNQLPRGGWGGLTARRPPWSSPALKVVEWCPCGERGLRGAQACVTGSPRPRGVSAASPRCLTLLTGTGVRRRDAPRPGPVSGPRNQGYTLRARSYSREGWHCREGVSCKYTPRLTIKAVQRVAQGTC